MTQELLSLAGVRVEVVPEVFADFRVNTLRGLEIPNLAASKPTCRLQNVSKTGEDSKELGPGPGASYRRRTRRRR